MKSLRAGLGGILAVVGLALFGYADVWGADWELLKKTEDTKSYSARKDVDPPPQKVVKVWVRLVYAKEDRDMISLVGARYENLSYAINSLEFGCRTKLMRFVSMTYYSENGNILDLEKPPNKWESIPPNSMFDALFKEVCK